MNKMQSDLGRIPMSILSFRVHRHICPWAQLWLYMCEHAYRQEHIPYTHVHLYVTLKKKVLIEFILYWVSTQDFDSGKGTESQLQNNSILLDTSGPAILKTNYAYERVGWIHCGQPCAGAGCLSLIILSSGRDKKIRLIHYVLFSKRRSPLIVSAFKILILFKRMWLLFLNL